MKVLELSDRDKAILGACAMGSVIGKKSIADATALFNANTKLGIKAAQRDIETISAEPKEARLEDAELAALKSMFEEGRASLRQAPEVLEAMLACNKHLEGAVTLEDDKKDGPKGVAKKEGELD